MHYVKCKELTAAEEDAIRIKNGVQTRICKSPTLGKPEEAKEQ